jgi:hypothetical protein
VSKLLVETFRTGSTGVSRVSLKVHEYHPSGLPIISSDGQQEEGQGEEEGVGGERLLLKVLERLDSEMEGRDGEEDNGVV